MLPLNTDWAAAKSDPEGQFPKWNNAVFFASRLSGGVALVLGPLDRPSFLLFRRLPNTLRPEHYTAGTSFTIRTRLFAAAARRKIQSTPRRPRTLVPCNPATPLIQLNTFSIRRRLFCDRANSGCSRSLGRSQFGQFFDSLYSATSGITPSARSPSMNVRS